MNIKVMGYLRTAREVAPHMIGQKSGRHHQRLGPGGAADRHHHRLERLVAALAQKNLGASSRRSGTLAVCVHPGLTRTETPGVLAAQAEAQSLPEAEIEKRMAARNLTRKIITAQSGDLPRPHPKAAALNGDVIAAGGGARGRSIIDDRASPLPKGGPGERVGVRGSPRCTRRALPLTLTLSP